MSLFRLATLEDAAFLLRVRNDPATLAASWRGEPVEAEEHLQWLTNSLINTNRLLFVAVKAGTSMGVGRLDFLDAENVTISITVAPEARGQGAGLAMLYELLAEARVAGAKIATAEIKPENSASIRMFLEAGFMLTEPARRVVLKRAL
jgi:L-amino acid N-acyltransferase YncA